MLKNEQIKYLQDTIDGIPVYTQGSNRGVSGSSQSSCIKTAMRELLQYKAVQANSENYNVIINDKKAQHLVKHKKNWQAALNNYRMWLASLSKQANDKQYRVISKTSTKANNDTTFTRVSLEPIPTVFSTDSPDKVFTIAKEQRDTLTAYDGALLMYNTLVKQYDFTEKS